MLGRLARLLAFLLAALAVAPHASASTADEIALAERYAPILHLVVQEEECGYGEAYTPLDVNLLFGEETVALRGPWGSRDLIRIAPSAEDLARGLYEHHLDFPGDALSPGCGYERWSDRLADGSEPTAYAHVVVDPGAPEQLALQFWFFYAFNDFNNKHEGDWEMIQLVFAAADAAEALGEEPIEVGYSQHEGAERADWDDEKLELEDGTHPVVYPAAGSHANYFEEALHLGRTSDEGVGCDDTTSATVTLRPRIETIPSDPVEADQEFPWIAYEGRWGELQEAFFNGPTGPNLKGQWTEPIRWAEDWRDHSYAVPAGGLLGTSATDFFCGAVGRGSDVLRQLINEPGPTMIALGALIALLLFALTRTTWSPSAPLSVKRRRAWGQLLATAARMYGARRTLFVGIAVVFLPIALVNGLLQAFLFDLPGLTGLEEGGEQGGFLAAVAALFTATLTIAGLGLVQAATARSLVEVETGREIDALEAYRLALPGLRRLLAAIGLAVLVVGLFSLTLALLPIAVWLAGRWALTAQAIALEDASALGALKRSAQLVRGRWFKVASLVVAGAGIALALGPALGALLILVTDAPVSLLNVAAGVVYVLAMPPVALTTSYVYFDALVRERLEAETPPDRLPAEI